jgi:hypothetical protein
MVTPLPPSHTVYTHPAFRCHLGILSPPTSTTGGPQHCHALPLLTPLHLIHLKWAGPPFKLSHSCGRVSVLHYVKKNVAATQISKWVRLWIRRGRGKAAFVRPLSFAGTDEIWRILQRSSQQRCRWGNSRIHPFAAKLNSKRGIIKQNRGRARGAYL